MRLYILDGLDDKDSSLYTGDEADHQPSLFLLNIPLNLVSFSTNDGS